MIRGPREVGDSAEKELKGAKLEQWGGALYPFMLACIHLPLATHQGLCWRPVATRETWMRSCPAFRSQFSKGKHRLTHLSCRGSKPSAGDTPGCCEEGWALSEGEGQEAAGGCCGGGEEMGRRSPVRVPWQWSGSGDKAWGRRGPWGQSCRPWVRRTWWLGSWEGREK